MKSFHSLFFAQCIVGSLAAFGVRHRERSTHTHSPLSVSDAINPNHILEARYMYPQIYDAEQTGTEVVDIRMYTNALSVNVDNLPDLTRVACSDDSVTITLKKPELVASWKKGTIMLINPGWMCDGEDGAAYRVVDRIADQTGKSVTFETSDANMAEYVESFELTMGKIRTDSPKSREYVGGARLDQHCSLDLMMCRIRLQVEPRKELGDC